MNESLRAASESNRMNDDPAVRLDALGLTLHADRRIDHVVHALPLEGIHRLEAYRLAVLLHTLRGILRDRDEFLATRLPISADIEQ